MMISNISLCVFYFQTNSKDLTVFAIDTFLSTVAVAVLGIRITCLQVEDEKALIMELSACSVIFTINIFNFLYVMCLKCRKPAVEPMVANDDDRIYDCPF